MGRSMQIAIVILVIAAAAAAFVTGDRGPAAASTPIGAEAGATALPTLIDLGRGQCVPCQMMEPVLEELRTEYSARLTVRYIDIGEQPTAVADYGVRTIPTQIFLDANGDEVFRHTGFFAKDDILQAFREHGIDL